MPAPAVTVNVPEQLPPTVVVNVPEQAAPVVNVIVPDIFQNIPEVRVHIQEVQFPTPIPFECTLPEINVTLEPVFHLGDAVAAASALRLAERYSKLACFGVAALVVFLLFFAVLVYDLQALLEHLALPGHHISP